MIINKNNIELMNELYLHDMKLLDIKIDYNNHKAEILLTDPENINHKILFEKLQSFSIGIFEQWGEGIYINEVKAITSSFESIIKIDAGVEVDEEAFITEILINSGDKIVILSSQIRFD